MPRKASRCREVPELRRQAEETALRGVPVAVGNAAEPLSPEAVQRMLHELRVHQIELELQNEELRRAQSDLDTAEARFFDFYDLAPVGYVTIGERGMILQANLTTATLLGMPRAQLVGQPFTRFLLHEDQDGYYLLRKQLLVSAEPQTREVRMVRSTGQQFWAQLVALAALDENGEPAFRMVLTDITERRQAQEEKENFETRARRLQKSESLAVMAGAIAHNFNNLLHAVMMSLDLAMEELPRGSGPAETLATAWQSARKAAQVSGLMLTFLGRTSGKREPQDLAEICRQGLSLLVASLPKGVELVSDLPSPGPVVEVDAEQIQKVLDNLMVNAWEAMEDAPGRIRVGVRTVAAADLPVLNRFPLDFQPADTAYACLEVADTGGGIAQENFEKIFDPFFTSKFTGRGLGLPVALGILRAHNGAITVGSEVGRGSVFQVFLPLSTAAVPRRLPPVGLSPSAPGGHPSGRAGGVVLVAEDAPAVRRAVALVLTRMGFSVLVAEDGVEAVEVFRQHQAEICCVLCDLTMPRMNGWETMAALRRFSPGVPVILTSAYSETQVMTGEHPEQPAAFLTKPYEPAVLIEAINRVVAGRRP